MEHFSVFSEITTHIYRTTCRKEASVLFWTKFIKFNWFYKHIKEGNQNQPIIFFFNFHLIVFIVSLSHKVFTSMVFRPKNFCKNLKPTGTSNWLVLLIAARKVGSYRDTDLNFKVDYGLVIKIIILSWSIWSCFLKQTISWKC